MDSPNKIETPSVEPSIFGSFFLLGNEFALSAKYVQEVVNAPLTYTSVPLAPNYLKGLFNLRGTVIPVIDLRELLNMRRDSQSENQKVTIIEIEGACIGLLFDKTGEVFKSHEDERSDFDNRQSNEVISGVFRKDGGRRIIQILDAPRLFKLQNVPKDSGRSRLGQNNLGGKRGNRKQCISFVVGPARCALPISDIQEIIKIDRLSETVLNVGHCIGSINLRGSTVPVIDFSSFLKYREVDRTETAVQGDRRIVVMRIEKKLFGLLVDSVDSIISFFPDELLTFPLIEQNRALMFLGCISGHGQEDILLLDHQKILTDDEVNEITRGHSTLYQNKDLGEKSSSLKGGVRRTYITFNIDTSYAVAIGEVKEIIDYPKQLLQPPGLKKHVHGVLNLRGDLVTIVDARSMYLKSSPSPQIDSQKVLVFTKNGIYFGLVVDAVEAIITVAENDKIKLPELLYSQNEGNISADISEAVEVTDNNGTKRSLLILSTDSLANRALGSLVA